MSHDETEIGLLLQRAETDTETFRAAAMSALQNFTLDDREYVAQLRSDTVDIERVLRAWHEKLLPERERLIAKRSDHRFRASLVRHIGFTDEQAREEIELMIDERLEILLDVIVDELYPLTENDPPDSLATQRAFALDFLSRPDVEIEDYERRYFDYIHHLHVAHAHTITVCDPYASWLDRQRCALQVRRERQQTREEEESRLISIDSQLEELAHSQDGLLGEVAKRGWDFVKLSDLRTKYEKRIEVLTDRQKESATKRLKAFDDVVRSFRDNEVEKASDKLRKPTLERVRQISEQIDILLSRFFDLSNKAKNSLLLDMKKYRTLTQEREMIVLIRKNRAAYEKRQA